MWDRAWILIVRGQVHNDKVWGRCKVGGGWRQGEAGAAGVGWKLGHFKVTGGGGGRGGGLGAARQQVIQKQRVVSMGRAKAAAG